MKFKTLYFEKNRKKIIVGIISLIVVIGIAIIIIKSFALGTDFLQNQVVDGLSFENASLEYVDGISTFLVEVYNESGDEYTLKNISIELTGEDGTITTLTGYIGETLEKEEAKHIRASIDDDLSDSVKLKYTINK